MSNYTDADLRKKIDNIPIFPLIIKNFLSENEVNKCMDYLNTNSKDFGNLSNNYWDGRVIQLKQVRDILIQDLMVKKRNEIMNILQSNLHTIDIHDKLYSDIICFSAWPKGYELKPHADSENPNNQPHEFYWRNFGAVMYLNSDYEGGEIFFPRLGLEIKPEPGMVAIFPGTLKFLHGVKKVTEGVRLTIATFLTFDKNKHDNRS